MKNIVPWLLITGLAVAAACNKNQTSERFDLLTAHMWKSDSLLADGEDAGGVDGLLESFNGDIVFNKDGTGTFGLYSGTWKFVDNEANLVIESLQLTFPLTTHIVELTETSLKVTFVYPTMEGSKNIRMTFKPK